MTTPDPQTSPVDFDHPPAYLHPAYAIDAAVQTLASLRGFDQRHGPAVTVHLLAALQHQLHRDLLDAVLDAHDHGYTPEHIACLLHLHP